MKTDRVEPIANPDTCPTRRALLNRQRIRPYGRSVSSYRKNKTEAEDVAQKTRIELIGVRTEDAPEAKESLGAIRWQMMIIFSFVSIISAAMIMSFSIALLNVVVRRESTYLIEERIKEIVDGHEAIMDPFLDRIEGCEYASNATLFTLFTVHLNASWPGSVSVLSSGPRDGANPPWLGRPTFGGIVEDGGNPEIRIHPDSETERLFRKGRR